eukprot:198293-Pelagomonas_calceolata.AAC.1
MSKNISVCAPLRASRFGYRYPPWFDAVCKQKRQVFRDAVQSGQAEHACSAWPLGLLTSKPNKFAHKQFRATAR